MTLEAHLGKLTKTGKDGKRALREYSPKSLLEVTTVLETLRGADLQTEEEMGTYFRLTGVDPKTYSPKQLEFFRKGQVQGMAKDLGAYVNAHLDNVVSELTEEEQIRLAIDSSPECEITAGQSEKAKKYDATRKHVLTALITQEAIQERPREVLQQIVKDSSPLVVPYILEGAVEYLGILNEQAKQAAITAVRTHKPSEFLKQTRGYLEQRATEFEAKQADLEKRLTEKEQEAQAIKLRLTPPGQDPTPTALEMFRITQGLRKEEKELHEMYGGLKTPEAFVTEIRETAANNILQKLLKEKAAKKRAEQEAQTLQMAA